MKKIISILTALVLMSSLIGGATLVSANEIGDGGYDVVIFEDGFENSSQGNVDKDEDGIYEGNIYTVYNDVTETWALSILQENREKVLHSYDAASDQYGSKGLALYDQYMEWNEQEQKYKGGTGKTITLSPTAITDGCSHVKYEFEINVPDGIRRYFRYHPNALPVLDVRTNTSSKYIKLYSGTVSVPYTPGTWVKVGIVVNFVAQEIQLFVNDELKDTCAIPDKDKAKVPVNLSYETASAVNVTEPATPIPAPSFLDNVKISVPSAFSVVSTLPESGTKDISPENASFKITANRNVNKYDIADLTVKDSKGNDADFESTIAGKDIIVTFNSFLKLGETYTVTVGGVSYSFTTKEDVPERIYYPAGINWDTMQYGSIADNTAWSLKDIGAENIEYVTEENGNKYLSVTSTTSSSFLEYNINAEYQNDEGFDNNNKYLYFTTQIAGWEKDCGNGALTISPVFAKGNTTKVTNAPIYLNKDGSLQASGGSKMMTVNPRQETAAGANKFYRIDIIMDMHTGTYHVYFDGQKFREYTESKVAIAECTNIKTFRISMNFADRNIKLDNVGYKVYSSDATVDSILAEAFPIDRIMSLSAYSLDSNSPEGRRYRVVVRASADEGAGSILVAAYDADGNLLDSRNLNGRKNENEYHIMETYTRNKSFVTDLVHGKGLESLSEVKTIKAFLIDMNSLTPITECATLDSSEFSFYQ